MTEKKKNGSGGKTRREFLKDAGLLVGGTAIGSTVLLAACGGEETTKTVTAPGATTTVTAGGATVTDTVTSTTTVGAGQTATVTAPGATSTVEVSKFICPIDNMEFDTLAELRAHFTAEHGDIGAIPGLITLNVNGRDHQLVVQPYWTLAFVLRDRLGLFGLKNSCQRGSCGHCTVIADGKAVYSCMMLAVAANGKSITTVESLSDGITLSPVQQAFYDNHAAQCGFCIPGYIMSAVALLNENSNPTRDEVREGLSGHWCSCGNTKRIVESVVSV